MEANCVAACPTEGAILDQIALLTGSEYSQTIAWEVVIPNEIVLHVAQMHRLCAS